MISEVRQNQKITAAKTNEIISRVNGMNPSPRFQTTPEGNVVWDDAPESLKQRRFNPDIVFQANYLNTYLMESRTETEDTYTDPIQMIKSWRVRMSDSEEDMRFIFDFNVPGFQNVNGIGIVCDSSAKDIKITDDFLARNKNKWIDTQLSSGTIYLQLWQACNDTDGTYHDYSYYLVISQDKNGLTSQVRTIFDIDKDICELYNYQPLASVLSGKVTNYPITLDCDTMPFVDSLQESLSSKSINWITDKYDMDCLELYNFENDNIRTLSVKLTNDPNKIGQNQDYNKLSNHMIFRDLSGNGRFVDYGEIVFDCSDLSGVSGNATISVDSQIQGLNRKSIDNIHDDDLSVDYIQLHDFDKDERVISSDLSVAGKYDVVLRDNGTQKEIKYTDVRNLLGGGGKGIISGLFDFQFDLSSHQLQVRRFTFDCMTGIETIGDWEMANGGQAYPHSQEVNP